MKFFAKPVFGLCLVLFASVLAYLPATHGPLFLDDFPVLQPLGDGGGVESAEDGFKYIFGVDGTDWKRSIARASFLLNGSSWPVNTFDFKATNLGFHLLLTCVLYVVLKALLARVTNRAPLVALIAASLWALSPANLSTSMYVVQRMTQLGMLFSLFSLMAFLLFRAHNERSHGFIWIVLSGISAILALLSKENSAVLLLLIPIVDEWILRNQKCSKIQRLPWLDVLKALAVLVFLSLFLYEAFQQGFDGRVFDRWQRLGIQGEVLFKYIGYALGIGIPEMTLFHDDLEWQVQRNGVGTFGYFWIGHGCICLIAYVQRQKWPLYWLAVLWFYVSHIIESTIVPLELMFEHRNYFGSVGIFLIVACVVAAIFEALKSKQLPIAGYGLILILFGLSFIGLWYRSLIWADSFIVHEKWAANHPNSLRSQMVYGGMLEQTPGFSKMALEYYNKIHDRFDSAALELARIRLSCENDSPIPAVTVSRISALDFESAVVAELKKLTSKTDMQSCYDSRLVGGGALDLYEALREMPLLEYRKRYLATYLDSMAVYYEKNGMYVESAMAREELYRVQPTYATALKFVDLLIAGGNFDHAAVYLDLARAHVEASPFNQPSITAHIGLMSQFLQSRMKNEE